MLLIVFLISSLLTLKIKVMVKLPLLSFRTTFTCFGCVFVFILQPGVRCARTGGDQ